MVSTHFLSGIFNVFNPHAIACRESLQAAASHLQLIRKGPFEHFIWQHILLAKRHMDQREGISFNPSFI